MFTIVVTTHTTPLCGPVVCVHVHLLYSRERILIMSILSLYIQKISEKARCHRISGSFGRKPLFHVIASQFKVAEAWHCRAKGRHPARDLLLDAIFEESLAFMLLSGKGRYHKKNCSNFENSNQLERKLDSFFYSAAIFSHFLTKQKCLERTCLIFEFYWFL